MKIKLTARERSFIRTLLREVNCSPHMDDPYVPLRSSSLRVSPEFRWWEVQVTFTKKGHLRTDRNSAGFIMALIGKVTDAPHDLWGLWEKFRAQIPREEYELEYRNAVTGVACFSSTYTVAQSTQER